MALAKVAGVAAAVALMGGAALGTASAHAAATCTWGGTPDAPTGVTTNHPGLTNFPSPGPLQFHATGALGGDCSGKLTFNGQMNAGSTCALITFQGTASGLPGITRFAGASGMGAAPARLYDHAGNVVGSENAQFLTKAPIADCGTPEGMFGANFSSVIELF
jgi:hypothetical protein